MDMKNESDQWLSGTSTQTHYMGRTLNRLNIQHIS